MKAQTKAIIASVVVIALALATVSSVTYSWFSDSEDSSIIVDVGSLDLEIDIGTPETSRPGSITVVDNNVSISGIAANYSASIPYTVSYNSNIEIVYKLSIETTCIGMKNYDLQNIMLNGAALTESSRNVDWTVASPSPNGIIDSGTITIETPTTYGDRSNDGKYILPDGTKYAGNDWSPNGVKKISISIEAEIYQGDYPYTILDNSGSATVPNNGMIIGSEDSNITSINFSSNNNYTSGSDTTSVSGKTVNATATPDAGNNKVDVSLELKDGENTINNPEFSEPVIITITVDGDLTNNNTTAPSVIFNGEQEQPTLVSYKFDNGKTTVTFSVTHFSNYTISKSSKVTNTTELQNALNAGGPVALGADITGNFTVPDNSEVFLDLNGFKITNSGNNDTITVSLNGTLIILDNSVKNTGTIDNINHTKTPLYNNGKTIINGGTILRSAETGKSPTVSGGNSYYTILNHGIIIINDGKVISAGHYSSLIENGYQSPGSKNARSDYVSGTNQQNPMMTINGGSFSGGINTVKNDEYGILTINDGYFYNTTQASLLNWNKAEINGGYFESIQNTIQNNNYDPNTSIGELIINGGEFISGGEYTTIGHYMMNETGYNGVVKIVTTLISSISLDNSAYTTTTVGEYTVYTSTSTTPSTS